MMVKNTKRVACKMYDREKAVAYAHKWALKRNPDFFNFDGMGGDCTNFISQCLYAGCGVMNYTPIMGWYYISPKNRTAAWSGVEFFYHFITTNQEKGPYGSEQPLEMAEIGDIIQLSFDGVKYTHALLIVSSGFEPTVSNILVNAHTYDVTLRPLNTYFYRSMRLIHIEGVRE